MARLTLNLWNRYCERLYIVRALQETGWNVSKAAQLSGKNRTDFHKLMQKHNVMTQREYRAKLRRNSRIRERRPLKQTM